MRSILWLLFTPKLGWPIKEGFFKKKSYPALQIIIITIL